MGAPHGASRASLCAIADLPRRLPNSGLDRLSLSVSLSFAMCTIVSILVGVAVVAIVAQVDLAR